MTLTMEWLHGHHFGRQDVRRRATVEWKTAALLGLVCGLLVAGLSVFWGGGPWPAASLAVSIALSMVASATVGLAIPIFLHVLRLDPRVASGPVVLMIADIITTAVYLAVGAWLLL